MSMDKLKAAEFFPAAREGEELPEYSARLLRWIEKELYYRISKRINFLLDRSNDNFFEFVKDGNLPGENGNWRIIADSAGDLKLQHLESGIWINRGFKYKGS